MTNQHTLTLLAACLLASCTAPQPDSFARADANKDDKLSRKEASDAIVEAIFKSYDANKDGVLTFAEWKQSDDTADAGLFAQRDTNKDGKLTLEESKASADRQNVFGKVFKEADTNGDGLMSRDEAEAYRAKKEGPAR